MGLILCNDCRQTCDRENLKHDYFNGGDMGESHWSCPYCGSDNIEDVAECVRCGKILPLDEVYGYEGNQICDDCIEEVADVRTVIEYGNARRVDDININGLFACVFDEDEINEILLSEFMKLSETKQKSYIRDFMWADKSDFADWYDNGKEGQL